METTWTDRYAQRTQHMGGSAIRELLKLTAQPDVISFAGGLPAPEVFPVEAFNEASQRVLREHGSTALQYSTTEGYPPLRELIAEMMSEDGFNVDPDQILITHGSQQALDLFGKIFINPGDHVAVERPTFLGALQAWKAYQAEYLTVPVDDEGMKVDQLEEVLRHGPKFLYTMPTFHNPAGVTLSPQRREILLELADQYGVPVVEDDPYSKLRYSGEPQSPLVALDGRRYATSDEGNVLYLGTFSKTLSPGLRLGWALAPKDVVRRMVQAKQGSDLHTSTFSQMVAYEVARDGFIDEHAERIRSVYRERRDAMLSAIAANFPEGVAWTHPEGGLFLWVTLPERIDAAELLETAVETEKIAFVPGHTLDPAEQIRNTMRLNFSYADVELIEDGMERLGRVLNRALAEKAPSAAQASD